MRLPGITMCLLSTFLLYRAQQTAAAGLTSGDAQPVEAEALLRRPDLAEVEVPQDPGYGAGPRRFRALPLAPLARGLGVTETAALVARAADGFVSHIPGALALRDAGDGARGWLAIEPPGQPWPPIPGKTASAGPFYILWQPADRSVGSEYWAYQVISLSAAVAPAARWPALNVAASLPPTRRSGAAKPCSPTPASPATASAAPASRRSAPT